MSRQNTKMAPKIPAPPFYIFFLCTLYKNLLPFECGQVCECDGIHSYDCVALHDKDERILQM